MSVRLALLLALLALSTYFFLTPSLPQKETLLSSLSSTTHPTLRDYRTLQKYLEKAPRPELKALGDFAQRAKEFKLFDAFQSPESGRICVHATEEELDNCILLYASFNKNYPQALRSLLTKIAASDFKGHILYRIGGFPNTDGGDLSLAFTPYAFKVAFFREAKRLGYKRALWLDCSIEPLTSLNDSFSRIAEKGYLAIGNTHTVGPFFNEKAAAALHTTLEESFSIPSVSAGILGLDFGSSLANQVLDNWYLAALDPHAFFSPRCEQNVISILLYQLGMTDWLPFEAMIENKNQITASSLYFLNRPFAHQTQKKKKQR